jgi:hypothetical protein
MVLMPQDRIRNGGGIHSIKYDRALAFRDAAGESGAYRDPDALPDLLLQPTRRSRHQLVAIAQQHCRGIGIENRADALEQFEQEVLDIEPGQRRVGDSKQIVQLVRLVVRRHGASLWPSHRPRHRGGVSKRVIFIGAWRLPLHGPRR